MYDYAACTVVCTYMVFLSSVHTRIGETSESAVSAYVADKSNPRGTEETTGEACTGRKKEHTFFFLRGEKKEQRWIADLVQQAARDSGTGHSLLSRPYSQFLHGSVGGRANRSEFHRAARRRTPRRCGRAGGLFLGGNPLPIGATAARTVHSSPHRHPSVCLDCSGGIYNQSKFYFGTYNIIMVYCLNRFSFVPLCTKRMLCQREE